MPQKNIVATKDCFFLAHDAHVIFRYSSIKKGQTLTTNQDYLEWFDTKEELQTRVEGFGIEFQEFGGENN